jgi:hypothetical protein
MGIWILGIFLLVACNLTAPHAKDESVVVVSVDRDSYSTGDSMVVSVRNNTDSLLTTTDHRSFCWIAQLERSGANGWEEAGPCYSMAPSAEVAVASGESTSMRVPVLTGTDAYPAVIQSGTYRWVFEYSTGGTFSFSRAMRVTSIHFTVR